MKKRYWILAFFVLLIPVLPFRVYAENETEIPTKSSVDVDSSVEEQKSIVEATEIDLGDYMETMIVGEKQLLSVTVLPVEVTDSEVTYLSSNTSVATINGLGRITAVAVGTTTITVSAGSVVESFELEVIEEEDNTVPVTDIEISDYETELNVDGVLTLYASVLPINATDSTITYRSSDESIATVSSSGVVKGIAKGTVDIILTAGKVTKTIQITVNVATTEISLNSDYIVLKKGDTYQLSATVFPALAEQSVTFKSSDETVAMVSSDGVITAEGTGTTAVIVTNGDMTVAATVIVNENVNYDNVDSNVEEKAPDETVYKDWVTVDECPVIDSNMLKNFYETGKILQIDGDGYSIEIDGTKIVNYENIFYTDITLERTGTNTSFVLNRGEALCGPITVCIEGVEGRYLYLYNSSKMKYERIDVSDIERLELSTSGEYQIRNKKLSEERDVVLYAAIGGGILLLICGAIFVLIKRRYWFW